MRITKDRYSPFFCGRRTFLLGAAATLGLWSVHPLTAMAGDPPQDGMEILRRVVPLMGTWVQVEARHPHREILETALEAAFTEAGHLEALLTRHDPAAPLGQLHATGFLQDAPPRLCAVLQAALHASARTLSPTGGFNPAVGPLLEALETSGQPDIRGLSASVRRDLQQLCRTEHIALGNNTIRLASTEMRLTLDGIAKGYVVDAMGHILQQHGVEHYLINAGGDMLAKGQQAPDRPWLVGIQHGLRADALVRTVPLEGALASSGNGERLARGLPPHILSAGSTLSVSVWAASAMQADALATALFSLPVVEARRVAEKKPLGHQSSLWQLADGSVLGSSA